MMHVDGFVRGKGKFMITEYVPTDEKTGPRFPLLLTTGRILSQYNVGAQTRRTENVVWHEEDLLEIHPHDAEERGIRDGDWVKLASRAGETRLRAHDHRPRGAGRGLHHVPPSRHAGQRRHHRLFRLGDQLPGIQGDGGAGLAVQRAVATGRRITTSMPSRAAASRARGGGIAAMRDAASPASPRTRLAARRAGAADAASARSPEETAVALTYNGGTYAVMMATPQDLEDFAVGFCLTEGIVGAPTRSRQLEDGGAATLGIELRMWLAEPRAAAL